VKVINPTIKLDSLKALTDDTGILQHTKFSIPNRKEGYTVDDNARALIACMRFLQLHNDSDARRLVNTYLSFLFHMQRPDGKFHNLLSFDRGFLDDVGSEECMGRALWACGVAISTGFSEGIKCTSKEIFDKGFQHISNFKSLRTKAFTILGLCHYYEAFCHDQNLPKNIVSLTNQLIQGARKSLDFLVKLQVIDDRFVPIGNKGWYKRDAHRALYDQQPIEASCMVEAAVTGFRATKEKRYQRVAHTAFDWFLGKNSKNVMVCDPNTGACYDGVTPHGLNLNQGAEATISYLLASLELETLSE